MHDAFNNITSVDIYVRVMVITVEEEANEETEEEATKDEAAIQVSALCFTYQTRQCCPDPAS